MNATRFLIVGTKIRYNNFRHILWGLGRLSLLFLDIKESMPISTTQDHATFGCLSNLPYFKDTSG
jgi:hypothetical protein